MMSQEVEELLLSLTHMLLVAQAEEVERQLECAEEQLLAIQQARLALEVELKWVAVAPGM